MESRIRIDIKAIIMRAQRIYKSQGQEEYWPVLHLRTLSFSSTPKNLKLERRYHNKAILIICIKLSVLCPILSVSGYNSASQRGGRESCNVDKGKDLFTGTCLFTIVTWYQYKLFSIFMFNSYQIPYLFLYLELLKSTLISPPQENIRHSWIYQENLFHSFEKRDDTKFLAIYVQYLIYGCNVFISTFSDSVRFVLKRIVSPPRRSQTPQRL